MLAEPEVRRLLQQLEQKIVDGVRKAAAREGDEAALLAQLLPDLIKTLLTQPAAVFVSKVELGDGLPDVSAAVIVNAGDKKAAVVAALEKLQSELIGPAVKSIELQGKPAYRIELGPKFPAIVWSTAGNHVVIGLGEDAVTGVFERVRTDAPGWLNDVKSRQPVERPSTLAYVNLASVVEKSKALGGPMASKIIDALGLNGLKSLEAVTGLEGNGFVARSLIHLEGEPAGLFKLLPQEPLTADDLATIPADATLALALRLDPDQVMDTVLEIAGEIDPRASGEILEGLSEINEGGPCTTHRAKVDW
jgi:hypothetical protein